MVFPTVVAPALASTWVSAHRDVLTAILSIVLAAVLAAVVDRTIAARGERLAAAFTGGELSAVADTRLRVLRRLATAAILVIGSAVAIAQFSALDKLAASILASGAIAAAVIGFAARQTLANAIAGVMLAVTQPLRVGDEILFEGNAGTVDDVRLTYTYLHTADGQRVVIPNERLAGGILRNDTVLDPLVAPAASIWLPLAADTDAALAALREALPDADVRIAELTHEAVRLEAAGPRAAPSRREETESQLRADALRALRAAGLLAGTQGEQPPRRTMP